MKKYALLAVFFVFPLFADAVKQTVPAGQVEKNVNKVMKIYKWQDSIDNLKEEAEEKGKMIFWLQVVGELDGGL